MLRLLLVFIVCGVWSFAQTPQVSAPAPAKNYTVSLFSDAGYHSMHIRGAAADLRNPNRIALTDLTLTIYTGDARRAVDTVILSPRAVFEPDEQRISGDGLVRLIRPDLELTGENWQYDDAAKKILIQRKAHIVFQAELGDLLK